MKTDLAEMKQSMLISPSAAAESHAVPRQNRKLWPNQQDVAKNADQRLACAQKQARKCFDSADYAMMQHKGTPYPERSLADLFAHGEGSTEMLPVKLEPTPMPPRRLSNLGDS